MTKSNESIEIKLTQNDSENLITILDFIKNREMEGWLQETSERVIKKIKRESLITNPIPNLKHHLIEILVETPINTLGKDVADDVDSELQFHWGNSDQEMQYRQNWKVRRCEAIVLPEEENE